MTPTEWGTRAAELYDRDYARRYREHDDRIGDGALVTRFSEWLTGICGSLTPPIDVLDLGCGTGRYFRALRGVGRLVGIDVSKPMLEEARHPLGGAAPAGSLTLVEGDFLTHEFEPGSFDLAYSIGVLGEHSPLDTAVARRIARWLRPGGRFAFTAIHRASFSVPRTLRRRIGEAMLPLLPAAGGAAIRERLLAGGLYVDEEYLGLVLRSSGFAVLSLERHVSDVHEHCLTVAVKAR